MTGWHMEKALERAEKEIARLHDENSRLRMDLHLMDGEARRERKQPDEHVRDAVRRLSRAEVHDPGNNLGRIEHIWAYLSLDEAGEGVCAGPLGPYPFVPFIAADPARLAQLGPLAREIARRADRVIILAKFGSREDVERIEP